MKLGLPTSDMPLNDYVWDVDAVSTALDALSNGFEWTRSPQGHRYWADVVRNLHEIRRLGAHIEAEKAPPCP
jgi:hypothetical protein